MGFGILMLGLASLSTYFYLRGKAAPRLRVAQQQPETARAIVQAVRKKVAPVAPGGESCGLLHLASGDLLQLRDVGLELKAFDGKVVNRWRWSVADSENALLEIDYGTGHGRVWVMGNAPAQIFWQERTWSSVHQLGLDPERLTSVSGPALDPISFEGCRYVQRGCGAARWQRLGDELRQISELVWWLDDPTEEYRVMVRRGPEGDHQAVLLARIQPENVSWTAL